MNKVDVKRLKKQLVLSDYEAILKALGIPIMLKLKDRWVLMTGCHNRDPLQGSQKLYFYIESKIFQCYTRCACSMDIIGLCQKRLALLNKPCAFLDAIQFILDTTSVDIGSVSRPTSNVFTYDWSELEKFVRIKKGGSALKPYDKAILDQLDRAYPQAWIDEGITIETMEKYKIGFYPRLDCATIPCFNREGDLIGIRARHWREEEVEKGKYRPLMLLDETIYKFPTNQVFYGINFNWASIEDKKQVILVEGEKSVLKADSFYGMESNVLALYGCNLGLQRRNEILKMGVNEVVIALDSDYHEIGDDDYQAFEKKVLAFGKQFKGYCDVSVCYNNIGLDGYKCSPFDWDRETFEKLFESREKII